LGKLVLGLAASIAEAALRLAWTPTRWSRVAAFEPRELIEPSHPCVQLLRHLSEMPVIHQLAGENMS